VLVAAIMANHDARVSRVRNGVYGNMHWVHTINKLKVSR
jgi:hypothetical protein